jgi:hypothetical protein
LQAPPLCRLSADKGGCMAFTGQLWERAWKVLDGATPCLLQTGQVGRTEP